MGEPRVALVHDYLVATGGAERVLLSLHRLFPRAPIYTAIFRPATTLPEFSDLDVRPLWPDHLPLSARTYRAAVAAFAVAFEGLRLEDCDIVVSSSSGFAKSAGSRARRRVCYCYTPPRFIWPLGASSEPAGRLEAAGRAVMRPALRRLDLTAARRVDRFATTSRHVEARIHKFYGRDAAVIHPAIELGRFHASASRGGNYLLVGRLARYRRFEDVVAAMAALDLPLTVVGTGPAEPALRRLAGPATRFAGRVSDLELADLYSTARALVVPGEEDWGLAALEANASGCPVIAAAVGGSRETVVDGLTGVLYNPSEPGALAAAVARFDTMSFDSGALRAHASKYSEESFHRGFAELVDEVMVAA